MRPIKKHKHAAGFTLAEMLTTLAIIGVLLALLIPALSMVEKKAKEVKQRAQFHAIEVGLEAFRSDWGDYPPSEYTARFGVQGDISPFTCASQRLAEALIGRDGLGFHQDSEFRARGLADVNGDGTLDPNPQNAPGIYNASDGFAMSGGGTQTQSAADNLAARKGPYLEPETANAVAITQYFSSAALGGMIDETYVLADAFKRKMTRSGLEYGMPILYYRARTDRIGMDPIRANWIGNTFNLNDSVCSNSGIIAMSVPFQSTTTTHPLATDAADDSMDLFYSRIRNPNFANPPRPYRANSFLLHSAGPDGLYGTADDMFNF